MTLGPLEYTVIGFEGNRFNGEIARELAAVVDSGVIALVDLVFVTKDIDGNVNVLEVDNKEDPRFADFAPLLQGLSGLLTDEDVLKIGEGLGSNQSALVVMFEHRWAVRVKKAIIGAGGVLVARELVSPESLEMLNAELDALAPSA
jgi:uncharacterized membrane protein